MEDSKIIKTFFERYFDLIGGMVQDYVDGHVVWGTIKLVIVSLPVLLVLLLLLIGRGRRPSKTMPSSPLKTIERNTSMAEVERQNFHDGVIIPPFDLQDYERGLAGDSADLPPPEDEHQPASR